MATTSFYSREVKRADDSESEQPQSMSRANDKSFSRNFDRNRQLWRLFRAQGSRMTLTGVLIAFMVVVIKIFEHQGNVGLRGKQRFNFTITIFYLILGSNFFEAFRDMAKVLRWRILANRDFSVRKADLILGCEDWKNIYQLILESPKKPLTVFFCILWVVMNCLAQIWIAAIGLSYSMDAGTNSTGIIMKPGNVTAANLDCYYYNNTCATGPYTPLDVAQDLAHRYGENIRAGQICPYTVDFDIQGASQDCYYFGHTNNREFAVRYAEYNPVNSTRAYPFFTNRVVKASAGECFQYQIDVNSSYSVDSEYGIQDVYALPYYNSTFNGTINVPAWYGSLNSTTYIYNGILEPQNATAQACGARCVWIYAWQNWDIMTTTTTHPMTLFKCPISISEVSNTSPHRDWQILPDLNARLAAASIALTGISTYNETAASDLQWKQYRLYPWGSYWQTQNLSAADVGAKMAEFAIGSLAVMADLNPQITVQGTVPILGYQLSVKWESLIPLVAGVAGVHFLLVILMLLIARSVVVPDDSHLCTAHLLQGLVGRLGERGSLLNEKEMAEAISSQGIGHVAYGIREPTDGNEGGKVLELGDNMKIMDNGKRFPKGLYK